MSERFNRNDTNVPDDRLFPADFQVDQNGQDEDIGRLIKDLGCLPCIGWGLDVTQKTTTPPVVTVSIGWAYDVDGDYGRRITVSSPTDVDLPTDEYNVDRFIVIAHKFVTDTPRNAHRTGEEYQTRKKDSFEITVKTELATGDICLAKCVQPSAGAEIQITTENIRLSRECKLISQDKVPGVIPEGEEAAGKPPPPGSQPELPDYPKARDIPMPIILEGTRNEKEWLGVETILPEELGMTDGAMNTLRLERVNLNSGTPLADVKVWFGDWGTGQRSGTPGEENKCVFTLPGTASGVSAWKINLWKTDPPGYYYLVRDDESWFSRITASDANSVTCEKDLPDADSHTFYICPYAELYRSQAIPYKTDAAPDEAHPQTARHYNRIASPTAPIVIIKDLNLGGKYKLKVASVISGDNYTQWAEVKTKVGEIYEPYFIVGSDKIVCWYPDSSYLNVIPVDGGVEVTIPAILGGKVDPEGYELCYTYGTDANPDPPEPVFTNPEHPTLMFKERKFKIDAPPGRKVKVKARAIKTRMVMQCDTADKILTSEDAYITAGGISVRRNRKQYTGLIDEAGIASQGTALADTVPLANPVWPEKIFLFNPSGTGVVTDIEVYVHGSNQTYTAGRKIEISESGDETEIGIKDSVEKTISDYRITDNAMKITVKNIDPSNPQDVTLRYGVQYREDSESEIG